MMHPTTDRLVAAVLIAAGLIASRPAAAQQSQSDLRRENQRLQTQVADLTRELEAARQEIAELMAETRRLRDQLAQVGGAAPPVPSAPTTVTVDESEPSASPRALLHALIASYGEATADVELGSDDKDPKRTAYLRRVERWVNKSNREYRSPIEWHVRIVERPATDERDRAAQLRLPLQWVDPVTEDPVGDPFDAVLTRSMAFRLRQLQDHGRLAGVLILKGTLVPVVTLNRERQEEGAFNRPPLIGPFAEFGFAIDAQSLVPKAPEKAGEEGDGDDDGKEREPR